MKIFRINHNTISAPDGVPSGAVISFQVVYTTKRAKDIPAESWRFLCRGKDLYRSLPYWSQSHVRQSSLYSSGQLFPLVPLWGHTIASDGVYFAVLHGFNYDDPNDTKLSTRGKSWRMTCSCSYRITNPIDTAEATQFVDVTHDESMRNSKVIDWSLPVFHPYLHAHTHKGEKNGNKNPVYRTTPPA